MPPTNRRLEKAEAEEDRRQLSAEKYENALRIQIATDRKKANVLEAVLKTLEVCNVYLCSMCIHVGAVYRYLYL